MEHGIFVPTKGTAEVLWSVYQERDECVFVGTVRGAIEYILVARWLCSKGIGMDRKG